MDRLKRIASVTMHLAAGKIFFPKTDMSFLDLPDRHASEGGDQVDALSVTLERLRRESLTPASDKGGVE